MSMPAPDLSTRESDAAAGQASVRGVCERDMAIALVLELAHAAPQRFSLLSEAAPAVAYPGDRRTSFNKDSSHRKEREQGWHKPPRYPSPA